jgi:hypothetical protein
VSKERPRGENVVDLMEALRRSVGGAAAETNAPKKSAKEPRKASSGQKEILMPTAGKKQAKEAAVQVGLGRTSPNSDWIGRCDSFERAPTFEEIAAPGPTQRTRATVGGGLDSKGDTLKTEPHQSESTRTSRPLEIVSVCSSPGMSRSISRKTRYCKLAQTSIPAIPDFERRPFRFAIIGCRLLR